MEWDWNSPDNGRHYLDHYIHGLMQVFGVSLLVWDYVITFDAEIRNIWSHPKSRSSILFLAFRYFTLVSNIAVVAMQGISRDSWTDEGCDHYSLYRQVNLFISQAVVCTLLTLRLYALYATDKRVLILYGLTASMGCGLAGYALSGQGSIRYPVQFGCHIGTSRETSLRIAGLWMVMFFYDTVVFLLTAYRTYQHWRRGRSQESPEAMALLSLMFRDGAMYFAIMALANLANILTFYLCGPFMSGGLSAFASCISAAMLCRLMLNLHENVRFQDSHSTHSEIIQTWRVRTRTLVARDWEDAGDSRFP